MPAYKGSCGSPCYLWGRVVERAAVFVDAGYLFAQGSAALSGSKKARVDLTLDAAAVIEELKALLARRAPAVSLLRIYWYDGALAVSVRRQSKRS